MIFWIFVIMLVVGLILYEMDICGLSNIITYFMGLFGGIISCILLVIIILNHTINPINSPEEFAEVYDNLTCKIESGACRDSNGYLTESMINEINNYNLGLEHYQEIQDDFWFGILYPNRYDNLKSIDLEKR